MSILKVVDNDKDQISVRDSINKEVRVWVYSHQQEQYWKMQMAREFVEGWHQAEAKTSAERPRDFGAMR